MSATAIGRFSACGKYGTWNVKPSGGNAGMIEVSHLTKSYGNKRGVSDISFKIDEGEIVGFLGPNGAGKTTTMNILTGYLSATSGVVKIAGIDILEDPIGAKKHIGYLPEQPPLYMDMTVREYLDFIYDLKSVAEPNRQAHIDEVLGLTGIGDVYPRVIKNLSKGYRQRVGLAQALIGDPDVLILDEPTVGLDPRQIIEIRNVIKELGKKRTIILSTHILPEVSVVCERVLVINNGVIVADNTPQALSSSVGGERKYSIRVSGPKEQVQRLLRAHDGVKYCEFLSEGEPGAFDFMLEAQEKIDIRKSLFHALARENFPILMLKPLGATLEDIFIQLVSDEPQSRPESGGNSTDDKEALS